MSLWDGVGIGENWFGIAGVDAYTVSGEGAETGDGLHPSKLSFNEVDELGYQFGGTRLGGWGKGSVGNIFSVVKDCSWVGVW
jgi:hypothetical protein